MNSTDLLSSFTQLIDKLKGSIQIGTVEEQNKIFEKCENFIMYRIQVTFIIK